MTYKLNLKPNFKVIVTDNRVNYSWSKEVGLATVTYSTEGAVQRGYIHNCEVKHGPQILGVTTTRTAKQLTRPEVESRFDKAENVSGFIQWAATGGQHPAVK